MMKRAPILPLLCFVLALLLCLPLAGCSETKPTTGGIESFPAAERLVAENELAESPPADENTSTTQPEPSAETEASPTEPSAVEAAVTPSAHPTADEETPQAPTAEPVIPPSAETEIQVPVSYFSCRPDRFDIYSHFEKT